MDKKIKRTEMNLKEIIPWPLPQHLSPMMPLKKYELVRDISIDKGGIVLQLDIPKNKTLIVGNSIVESIIKTVTELNIKNIYIEGNMLHINAANNNQKRIDYINTGYLIVTDNEIIIDYTNDNARKYLLDIFGLTEYKNIINDLINELKNNKK